MKMSFSSENHWETNGSDFHGFPAELPPYGAPFFDPHHHQHHLAGGPSPPGHLHHQVHPQVYPDVLAAAAAFNSDLVWPRQHAGAGGAPGRLSRSAHHHHQGSSGGSSASSKKTRRRVATMAQRRAANIRERRRMFNLNEAFDKLRRKVPTFAYEKRLSRIETLRLAITYISFMTELLHGHSPDHKNGEVYPREYIPYGIIN